MYVHFHCALGVGIDLGCVCAFEDIAHISVVFFRYRDCGRGSVNSFGVCMVLSWIKRLALSVADLNARIVCEFTLFGAVFPRSQRQNGPYLFL